MKRSKAYYRGCMVGGAIGDALAYPRKYMSPAALSDLLGPRGIDRLIVNKAVGKALISDDTQLTAFTADGVIWADSRARKRGVYAYIPCIFYSYQKWLYTQSGSFADRSYEFLKPGEIFRWEDLFARRLPNPATLDVLEGCINGKYGTMKVPVNNMNSYGPVARVAPVGMYFTGNPEMAFKIGSESAALTHGNPSAWYAAGYFAALIAFVLQGEELELAAKHALEILRKQPISEEVQSFVEAAISMAGQELIDFDDAMKAFPSAAEAGQSLGIGLFCALRYRYDFEKALKKAANSTYGHNGAATICGSLLGAYLGSLEIPYDWIRNVELSDLMVYGADRILEGVLNTED